MRLKILIVLLLAVAVAAGLSAYSYFLTLIFALSLILALVYRYAAVEKGWLKGLAVVMVLGVALIAWRSGRLPEHLGEHSSAQSTLPVVGTRLSSVPASYVTAAQAPRLNELEQRREQFHEATRKVRVQKTTIDRAMELEDAVDAVVAFGNAQSRPVAELLAAKRQLATALAQRALDNEAARQAIVDKLETYVRSAEGEMAKAGTPAEARARLADFRGGLKAVSVDDINDQMLALEDAIAKLTRETIAGDLHLEGSQSIRLDEAADRLVRRQAISWTLNRFPLQSIDASELMLDHDPDALEETLFAAFGPDLRTAEPVSEPRDIPVAAGVRQITLIKQTISKAGLSALPSSLRWSAFEYFLLKLPHPTTVKLRATMDLSSMKGPPKYFYAADYSTDAPVREIRVPHDSLFAASYAFNPPRREGEEDVYAATPALQPSFFLTTDHLWFELMPESFWFRNGVVQKEKDLLFAENLFAALVVSTLGVLLAAIFS